jgi:hypothetical protein
MGAYLVKGGNLERHLPDHRPPRRWLRLAAAAAALAAHLTRRTIGAARASAGIWLLTHRPRNPTELRHMVLYMR